MLKANKNNQFEHGDVSAGKGSGNVYNQCISGHILLYILLQTNALSVAIVVNYFWSC